MSAITAKASRKMKKYAVLTREPRCFLGSFDFSWEQRKVREVTDRYDNLRIPVAASLRVAGTTPYYGANGIQDYVEGYTHDGEFILVAEDGANDLKNYPVKCVKGRIWVNNHAHVLQGKYACADNQFLAYAISQADIESLLVGGGRAKLNAETLMDIELLLPSKDEQIQIGHYIARLDNLITLHQRKFEKLTNVKKSMLEKMFPQNGSSYPEIRFKGFTDPWEQRKLGELIQQGGSGGTPSANNPDYYGGDIPFLSIADISGRDITNTAKTLTDEGLQNSAAWIVPSGAVSLAMYASVGKVGIIRQDTATSQAFYNMVFENEALRDFVFTRLEKAETDSEWEPYISTGTQRNLNADKVKSFSLDVPSNEEASEISAYFANLDTLITLHQREPRFADTG